MLFAVRRGDPRKGRTSGARDQNPNAGSAAAYGNHFAILFASAIAADHPSDVRTAVPNAEGSDCCRYFLCGLIAAFRTAEKRLPPLDGGVQIRG